MNEQIAMDLQLDMPALTQLLKEQYKGRLPMRAVLTAMKIVRRRDTLATHPKEPMPVHWQDYLEQTIAAAWGCQG